MLRDTYLKDIQEYAPQVQGWMPTGVSLKGIKFLDDPEESLFVVLTYQADAVDGCGASIELIRGVLSHAQTLSGKVTYSVYSEYSACANTARILSIIPIYVSAVQIEVVWAVTLATAKERT